MVVLAASVVTKGGKALVSRQYMEMSRIRIEGLLAAFPKLVGTGKQHTYVETENVRYIFQPMEGLYLLLITNKQSNILEDLDTLRMLSKLLPEFSSSLDEEAICKNGFDLVFAFDEVISLGHKDNITISQVKQNCEMESHEEKLHKMIIQSKINDTKDVMKKKASEIDKNKLDQKKMSNFVPATIGSLVNTVNKLDVEMSSSFSRPDSSSISTTSKQQPTSSKGPSKGMQLGKTKKANDFLENLAKEGEVVELEVPSKQAGAAPSMVSSSAAPLSVTVDEKLTVSLNKTGGVENVEIAGVMSLLVTNDVDALCKIVLNTGPNKGYNFKTHPNIDKSLYSTANVLGVKDPSRPFPINSEQSLLKWRLQSKDEAYVPLTVNCWPSVSGRESFVNVEYESTDSLDLQNVTITIPLPHVNHAPTINQIDGEWRFDSKRSALVWQIELIDDTNRNGSMEFVVPVADADVFYPIDVSFSCSKIFCDMSVESVLQAQHDTPLKYVTRKALQTQQYQIG